MDTKNTFQSEPDIDITTGWINLNTGCNNRCLWCYRQDGFESTPQTMSIAMAEQLVDLFIGLNVCSCVFIGGEPTLYAGLPDLVKRAKIGHIKETTIVTNGRLLKDKKMVTEFVESGLDVFSISIHSAFPEIHDAISRRKSWKETVAGIKNVVKSGKLCSLNVVAGKQNIGSIKESLPIFIDWGAQRIIVSCAIPCLTENGINGENALDPRRFAELIEDLVEMPPQVVILHELPLCLIPAPIFLKLIKEKRLGYGCHIGIGKGLCVDVNGGVMPCNSFPDCSVTNLFRNGKLLYSPEDFLNFWRTSTAATSLRQKANVKRSATCNDCKLWELCNCGCPLNWGFFEPDDYINSGLRGVSLEDVYK